MSRTWKLNLVSTGLGLAFVLVAVVSVNAQQSIVNTTKSNVKEHSRVASPPESGSAKGWDGKVQGKANRFDPIVLDLKKGSGEKVLTRQIADLDNDGKLSETENAFEFGVLPAGDYVLNLTIPDKKQKTPGRLDSKIESADGNKATEIAKQDADVDALELILNGVVGGPLKQKLQAQITTSGGELSRSGTTKFKNIVLFKADGRSQVRARSSTTHLCRR